MKFFSVSKDGGPESTVTAYWLVELKGLFSIALLKFGQGTRDVYHNHAFNSISWVLSGGLFEIVAPKRLLNDQGVCGYEENLYEPSIFPVFTYRSTMHQVIGLRKTNWVLTFRGPWSQTWNEQHDDETITLANGRVRV